MSKSIKNIIDGIKPSNPPKTIAQLRNSLRSAVTVLFGVSIDMQQQFEPIMGHKPKTTAQLREILKGVATDIFCVSLDLEKSDLGVLESNIEKLQVEKKLLTSERDYSVERAKKLERKKKNAIASLELQRKKRARQIADGTIKPHVKLTEEQRLERQRQAARKYAAKKRAEREAAKTAKELE